MSASIQPPLPRYQRVSDRLRERFDRMPPVLGSVTLVAALLALTSWLGIAQLRALEQRCPAPPDLVELEVAFSVSRFHAVLKSGDAPHVEQCSRNAARSFVTWDMAFPFAYAPLLAALFLWLEQCRRVQVGREDARGRAERRVREAPRNAWRDVFLLAPLAAGALDLVENLTLGPAALPLLNGAAAPYPLLVHVAVALGSTAALGKWLLLLSSVAGIAIEAFSGPRGRLLVRMRFSALALALGALPLLLVDQGQDILQRLLEGEHPLLRAWSAVAAVTFAAAAIWYCARRLAQIRFDERWQDDHEHAWHEFFAENIPRLLGIAMLLTVGLAFAQAGLVTARFAIGGAVAFFSTLVLGRLRPRVLGGVGRIGTLRVLHELSELEVRIGRFFVAALISAVVLLPGLDGEHTWHLRLTAYLCLVAAWAFYLFVYFRREVRAKLRPGPAAEGSATAVDAFETERAPALLGRQVRIGALASAVCLTLFAAIPVEAGRVLGALWVLSLVAANAVFVGSISVWVGRRYQLPVFRAAVAVALMFSLWNDNHVVRLLSDTRPAVDAREKLASRLATWKQQRASSPDAAGDRMVLVAAEGGGLRAAYWTALSLARIQDRAPSFASHVFAFSGVSGGSLGGVLFAALVRDSAREEALPCSAKQDGYVRCVRGFMSDDFLAPVLAKLLGPDLLQWFLPISIPAFDRATALEASWEASYSRLTGRATFSEGFTELARDPSVPALFLNGTHVQSGRRFVTSSVTPDQGALLDSTDLLAALGGDVRLSTAVHNSARFSYVSPAGRLRSASDFELGHIVDGGYFENSGLETLHEIHDFVRRNEQGPGADPIVLYLCNDPSICDSRGGGAASERAANTIGDEWLSPVRTLLHTRGARGSLARAGVKHVAPRFMQLNVCASPPPKGTADSQLSEDPDQRKRAKERTVSPPLGWVLSELSRGWMDASLDGTSPDPQGDCYQRNAHVLDELERVFR